MQLDVATPEHVFQVFKPVLISLFCPNSRTSSLDKLSRQQSEEDPDSADRLQTDRRQGPGQTSEGGSLEGTLPPDAGAAAGRHQRCTLTGSQQAKGQNSSSTTVTGPFYPSSSILVSLPPTMLLISMSQNNDSKAVQQCQITIWKPSRKSYRNKTGVCDRRYSLKQKSVKIHYSQLESSHAPDQQSSLHETAASLSQCLRSSR